MGKVRLSEHWTWREFQETYEFIYEYTYCDKCGSFDIRYPSTFLISVIFGIITVFLLAALGYLFTSSVVLSYFIVTISLFVGAAYLATTNHLACRKCGNRHITSENSMNYQKHDSSVLDVPKERAKRRHIETKLVDEG